jgi:hypothetical protein
MRKLIAFFLLAVYSSTFATKYTLDENSLDKEFKNLNNIEEQVQKSNFDTSVMKEITSNPASTIVSAEPLSINQANEFYMDWESFAWGFCCCPVGFFTVAVNNNKDSDMKTSYWIGVASYIVLSSISAGVSFSLGTGCYVY